MELYTEKDLEATKKKVRFYAVMTGLVVLILIAWIIVFIKPLRNQIALLAGMCVLSVALFYFITVKLTPWVRYRMLQKDIGTGRSHEVDCRFISLSDSTRMSDGVEFHDMIVSLADEDPEDEEERQEAQRLFMYDADKPDPGLKPNQKIHIKSFGNYITAYDIIG